MTTSTLRKQLDTPNELYIDRYPFAQYLDHLRDSFAELYTLLDQARFSEVERHIQYTSENSWEFEDESTGGRGAAYNVAQKNISNRELGMTTLLNCLGVSQGKEIAHLKILDVLGGDGTFARFCKTLPYVPPMVFTGDISKFMMDACFAQALPCIRQSATKSLFHDGVLDGVLIAYGSHHLDRDARLAAVSEAHRTLRTGGRLVLHDFEIGGRCAQWFDRVVHPYSATGHAYPHFSRHEMFDLLTKAGFRDVRVFDMDDSFSLSAETPKEAKRKAIMHMYHMYGLVKLDAAGAVERAVERLIDETLGPIAVRKVEAGYVAQIHRQALVAVGVK